MSRPLEFQAACKAHMIDSALSIISEQERHLAVDLLNSLMDAVGDQMTRQVSAVDLHRVLAFIAAIVVEADSDLSEGAGFLRVGVFIGELIAHHAAALRQERKQAGAKLTGLDTSKNDRTRH